MLNARKNLPSYLIGLTFGVGLVLSLFAVLFGAEDLYFVARTFLGENLSANYYGRPKFTNFVSFTTLLFEAKFLPIFAFLLVGAAAYRQPQTRRICLFAWTFIAIIYFFYYASERGYLPKARYIYPAFVFALLAATAWLGERFNSESQLKNLAILLLGMLLLFGGLWLGDSWSPQGIFKASRIGDFPRSIGTFYGIGALVSLSGLLLLQVYPNLKIFGSYCLFLCLWISAFQGGLAIHKVRDTQQPKTLHFMPLPKNSTSKPRVE